MGGGKARGDWREALRCLMAALDDLQGPALSEAKDFLAAALATVESRLQEGDTRTPDENKAVSSLSLPAGSLKESMCVAGLQAAQGKLSRALVSRIVLGITAKVQVKVDRTDPANFSVTASARGEWGLDGKTHKILAVVTEKDSRVSQGKVEFGGLCFTATGDLSKGQFNLDTDLKERFVGLASESGLASAEDVLRVVIVALEILSKKKARGIADVDVLKVVFNLMKHEAGVLATTQGHASGGRRRRLAGKTSVAALGTDTALRDEHAGVEGTDVADIVVSEELSRLRERAGADDEEEDQEDEEEEEDCDDEEGEEEEEDSEYEEEDEEEEHDEDVEEEQEEEGDDHHGDENSQFGMGLTELVEDTKGKESNDDKDKPGNDATSVDNDRCERDDERPMEVEAPEEVDVGAFVGKRALAALRSKVTSGGPIEEADLLATLDVDALPEDEDIVPIEPSELGEGVLEGCVGARALITRLIAKYGAANVAAQKVLAAADALDAGDCNGEEEDGEEEEAVEDPVTDCEHANSMSALPALPCAKRPRNK